MLAYFFRFVKRRKLRKGGNCAIETDVQIYNNDGMSESNLANLYSSLRFCLDELSPEIREAANAVVILLDGVVSTIDPDKKQFDSYVDRLQQAISDGKRLQRKDFDHPLIATQALYSIFGKPVSWLDYVRPAPKNLADSETSVSEKPKLEVNPEFSMKGAGLYKNWSPLVRSILLCFDIPVDRGAIFGEMQRLSPTKPPPTFALSYLLHYMWQKKEITMAGSSPQKWCLEPGLPAEMLCVFTEDGSYAKPAAEPQRRSDRPPTKKELIIGFVKEKGERTNSEMMEFCTRFGARDKIDMWDICNAIVELEPVKVPMGVYGDTRTAGYKLRSALNA